MGLFQKVIEKRKQGQDKSKELLNSTIARLETAGMTDATSRLKCSQDLLKSTSGYMKHLVRANAGKEDLDEVCLNWTNQLKEALIKYGITDQVVQEEFILDYITKFADIVEA